MELRLLKTTRTDAIRWWRRKMMINKLWWVMLAISFAAPTRLHAQEVTVDALMRLRSVSDVQISPDGNQIAFIASNPPTAEEERRRKEKSYVIAVDRDQRIPRIWLQEIPGGAPRGLTPADKTVLDFHWAPDGKGLVYAASDESGFNASYNSAVYTISVAGGESRAV